MMKKSFWYNSDQNGDLLKPRTGHGQYVVDIDNMLFAIREGVKKNRLFLGKVLNYGWVGVKIPKLVKM